MNKNVSVIVPVYNVEKYLDVCVKSILNSNYHHMEIILVDDGSTDTSGTMCDEWSNKDSRINVIHKMNGGLSDARNAGIEVAKGEYITFIDSDDYIGSNFIGDLVELLERNDADIAIAPMCHVKESTNDFIVFNELKTEEIMNSRDAIIASMYQKKFSCNAPSKLFKAYIFQDICFPIGRVSEDLAIAHKLFDKAGKIAVTNKWGYFYRQRDNSIMHSFNKKRIDALVWLDEIFTLYGNNDKEVRKSIQCRMINVAIHLLLDIPNEEKYEKEKELLWRYIKKNRITTIFNRNARKVDRGAAMLSILGENILKIVWNSELTIKRKEM